MNRGDGEVLSDPNQFTIGIELANWGPLVSDGSAFWGQIGSTMFPYEGLTPKKAKLTYPDIGKVISCYWEPYPELQIEALLWLLSELRKEGYEDAVNNLAGHEEVAMPLGRKMDPGPLFPWERLGRTSERTEGELV
jgi:N-acetyl-anhydromuramyl-L-alanine amidase AmpD